MGISIWQLLIVFAIVLLLFGTKKLRNIGGDLGGAIKGFRDSMTGGDKDKDKDAEEPAPDAKLADATADSKRVIDGEVSKKETDKASSG